jgi:hypothetical protein
MASEISHVVYAARVLTNLGSQVKEPTFWVGTLLPNIYQLNIQPRHRLHPGGISLYSLVAEKDFATGLRVHNWIDVVRENYLRNNYIKEKLPWSPLVPEAFRLLEDDLLYDYFEDWDLVFRLLNKVNDDELNFVSERTMIAKWHEIIQHYIEKHPNDNDRQRMLHDKGLTKTLAKSTVAQMHKLNDSPTAIKLLEGFWGYLEDTLD